MEELKDTVILKCDVQKTYSEISKKSNVWELLLSVATTYSYKENRYRFWTGKDKDRLVAYLNNKHVVCFNGIQFDLPLLLGQHNWDPTFLVVCQDKGLICTVTDLFIRAMMIIYKENVYSQNLFDKMSKHPLTNFGCYSLLSICECTFNIKLQKDYLSNTNSVALFKNSKMLELVQTNLEKTRYIKKLYEFLTKFKYLINGDYDILKIDNIKSPKDVSTEDFMPF